MRFSVPVQSSTSVPRHRSIAAFTLIEVLVAIGIFSMVVISIYSTWTAIIRATQVGQKYAVEAQRSRIAIKTIEDALVGAVMFSENIRYYSFETESEGDFAAMAFTARLGPQFPGSGLFPNQPLRRLTFTIEPDKGQTNQLVMTQTPVLLATNDTLTPYPLILAKDVSLFVVEFWDVQKGDWADKFVVTNQLPKMMRVTIGIGHAQHSSDPDEVVSRVIALPAMPIMGDIERPLLGPQGGILR